ncbi:hypothetical protein IPM65_05345 [Candidatus Roizmanbacteria bacterium]|nr:MAG: hypothetical protein IPM65_05345 [Candidatus Roizmanbacteria bacterium]
MLYSKLFPKPQKQGKEYDSVNATYLQNGGFIHQTMAGVYSYLPLGMKVLSKIEQIVRSEMDKIGQEVLMPSIVPTKLWEDTKRLEVVDVLFKVNGANKISRERNDAEYILNPTHEEVVTPLAKLFTSSYKELPFAVYQIQTKFRNEPRAKSGILRGREFRMKDLYSFHTSEEDLLDYYDNIAKPAYINTFKRLGLGESTVIALASGGDFTEKYSHEFQTLCETGEDTLYYDKEEDVYYNKEVVKDLDNPKYEIVKAAEVGNIFPLNTKFSEALDFTYTDESGDRKLVYMGCYGIGTSRVMGVLVEKFHDEKGIIWPIQVAPYHVHLVTLDLTDARVKEKAFALYQKLQNEGIEVLFDDREDVRPGAKFADADLIGIPVRLVISKRTEDKIEWKKRNEKDAKIISVTDAIKQLKDLVS